MLVALPLNFEKTRHDSDACEQILNLMQRRYLPYLNSSLMMVRVDEETLYVEFCWG